MCGIPAVFYISGRVKQGASECVCGMCLVSVVHVAITEVLERVCVVCLQCFISVGE